jgi:hypothetical protein
MVNIRFQDIKVHTISDTSGVFNGSNIIRGREWNGKRNEGFGTVGSEHSNVTEGIHVVMDQDLIDQWMRKGSKKHE